MYEKERITGKTARNMNAISPQTGLGAKPLVTTTTNTGDEFRNVSVTVSVTEVGVAGWTWSTHA